MVLFRGYRCLFGRLTLHDLGQAFVIIIDNRIIAALFIDPHKAIKQHHLTSGAQAHLSVVTGDVHRGAFQPCGLHLTRQRAFPDQIIQFALICVGDFQRRRIAGHIRGPDTFVRFLGVFRLVFIHTRGFWHIFIAIAVFDRIARGCHRFGRHINTVCPHVSDAAGLIEALGRAHRLACTHAKFAAGFLLQG